MESSCAALALVRPAAGKRKAAESSNALGVTDWVTVRLNQTRQVNKNIATAPAIVSSIDEEKGTVNVLFPNRLSAFFNRCCPQTCVRFSIQTFPLSKVHRHESPSEELKPLLQHALASFAELREAALRGSDKLLTQEESVEASDPAATKAGASEACSQAATEPPPAKRRVVGGQATAAPETPPVSHRVVPAESPPAVPGQGEPSCSKFCAAEKAVPAGRKLDMQQGDLGGFTRELAQLLRDAESGCMPKAHVRESLSSNYPEWDGFLKQLDQMNKVLLAEDAVFSLA